MKKYLKRKIAIMLSLILLISGIDVNVSMSSASEKSPNSSKITTDNFSVKSTNSVGELIEEAVAEKENEKETNNGNNIFSVEMREKTQEELEDDEEDQEKIFVVNFETVETCKLLLAIYTEDGKKMITSSTSSVCQDDTNIEFWLEKIPEFFIIRAFLIDSETNQPLCIKYESPMYTKEMQDFMAKETKDFDKDRVLNLDDSENNNFAVYDKDTKVIDETSSKNVLRDVDENEQRYVFDNIDSKISLLKEGEILSYEKEDNNVLIVKVHEIEIDGNTAVIIGEDTSMDEVFDYVKIDGEQDLGDSQIEESKEDGIQYEGLKKEKDISTRAFDYVGKESLEASVKFIDKKVGGEHAKAKVNGSVKLSMTTSVKVYVSLNYQYLEMKIDFKLSNEISLSGAVKGSIPLLATVGFSPVPGVIIEFTPSISLEGSASVTIKATVKATVGFSVSPQDGFKNLTSSPKYDDTKIEGKVNVFLGLSLEPKVVVISKAVAEASVKATAGGVINGSLELYSSSPSESVKHDCKSCIEGDISAKIVLSVDATFVSALKIEHSKEYQFKITDFYYSIDSQTWGWRTCPNKQYKITVYTKNPDGKPVAGAKINDSYTTDKTGVAVLWLPDGIYELTARKAGQEKKTKTITIKGNAKKVTINFATNSKPDDGSGNGEEIINGTRFPNPIVGEKVREIISRGDSDSMGVITESGDLYTWGDNWNGQAGVNKKKQHSIYVPTKILSHVLWADIGVDAAMAITENGDLYVWGETGLDETHTYYYPQKILGNIKEAGDLSIGKSHYALSNEGKLYTWGWNYKGTVGQGKIGDEGYSKPKCILDKVERVFVSSLSGAITENGDLYVWGGEGHNDDANSWLYEPTFITANVKSVNFNYYMGGLVKKSGEVYTFTGSGNDMERVESIENAKKYIPCNGWKDTRYVITENDELYMWGDKPGSDTEEYLSEPQKIMSDVSKFICCDDPAYAGVLTNSGEVYMWGENDFGLLGNGTTKGNDIPKKILSNVRDFTNNGYSSMAAILNNGDLYMWGENDFGQIGNGTFENCYIPTKVMSGVEQFSMSLWSSAVVTKDKNLYTWGYGMCGVLGNGRDFSVNSPYCVTKQDTIVVEDRTSNLRALNPMQEESTTKQIDGLLPNNIYNIYFVEDEDEDILNGDNLHYVDQLSSDENGDIFIEVALENGTDCKIVAEKLGKGNISNAKISISRFPCNGNKQWFDPVVLYDGIDLVEGKDYELCGDVCAKEAGKYQLTIMGIGYYTGEQIISVEMYCDNHQYGNWRVIKEATEKEEGEQKRECVLCGQIQLEKIAKKPSSTAATNKNINNKPRTSSKTTQIITLKKPGKVTGLKVKNKKKKKLVISWNWKVNMSGFQIQYAQNKKFTKKKKSKMVGKWTSQKTITKLKKGKTYYVRVRAYKKSSSKKVYGKWSKVKKIKIKK